MKRIDEIDSNLKVNTSINEPDIRFLEIGKARNYDLIAIDQLSLLGTVKSYKSIREGYIHSTRTMRQFVNTKRKPIYLNCQAGREASKFAKGKEDNTPELHQIAESDSVGQDATKILSIHNADGILKLSLRKNTLGISNLESLMAWDIDKGYLKPTSAQDQENPGDAF
jgi:replicative DNA helicase